MASYNADMNGIRRTTVALALLAALAAHAAMVGPQASTTADAAASAAVGATPGSRPAPPPWREDLPADRAIALLVLAGIGLLGLRASRNRE